MNYKVPAKWLAVLIGIWAQSCSCSRQEKAEHAELEKGFIKAGPILIFGGPRAKLETGALDIQTKNKSVFLVEKKNLNTPCR